MDDRSYRPRDLKVDVVERNIDKMYRTALAIMGNKADAEDVVQDVFVTLFNKEPDFESSDHETAWLIRVTVNICKNRLNSYWWKKSVPLLESYPAPTEEHQSVMNEVISLPVKYRIVIHLYYYEGYSTKEIAEMTRQRESTVRAQMTRARSMLKKSINNESKEKNNGQVLRIHE